MFKLGSLRKFHYNFNPILQNRIVLYFFFFLAFVELIYFFNTGDAAAGVTLLLVGLLTTFFSKNMIVVIVVSLVVTNLIKFGIRRTMEGMEGQEDNDTESNKEDKDKDKDKDDESNKENKDSSESTTTTKVDENYENLRKEYPQFKVVQQEILDGVKKMAPLLDKAEKFIDKFDKYKKSKANIE